MDIVPIIISIIAVCISLSNWIYTLLRNRLNVDIQVINCLAEFGEDPNIDYVVHAFIYNKSALPISINKIVMQQDSDQRCCLLSEQLITTRAQAKIYSTNFPINLNPYGSIKADIIFQIPLNAKMNPHKPIDFIIHSTRGSLQSIRVNEMKFVTSYVK